MNIYKEVPIATQYFCHICGIQNWILLHNYQILTKKAN